MKKNNTILLDINKTLSKTIIQNFKKKFILINSNIYEMEKLKKKYLIPLNTNNEENYFLKNLIKKKIKNIKKIIIITEIPNKISPFEITNLKEKIIKNIFLPLEFINNIFKLINNKFNLFLIIHKESKNKKQFWSYSNCINGSLIYFIKTINDENKNINNVFSNCISTENINTLYKNTIYPYKKFNNIKNIKNIFQICSYIKIKKIKNKIIKI